jgi:phosphoglycolate phosphatase-like HAD superfamily hydrolase
MREPDVQPDHGSAAAPRPAGSSFAAAVAVPLLALGLLGAAVWLGSLPSQRPEQPAGPNRHAADEQPADPLPSWRDGPAKQAILTFVAAVTRKESPDHVPPAERIAVFDHDGTLACERPLLNGLFIIDRVRGLVARDASLAGQEPYATLLSGDLEFMRRLGRRFLNDVLAATLDGVPESALDAEVREFLDTTRHPLFDVSLEDVAYEPMKELLALLHTNGFTVWLCSGSSVHFMRPLAETWYGIPPDRVIGSRPRSVMVEAASAVEGAVPRIDIVLLPELEVLNDGPQKPVSIATQVGRRPILAVGNIGGGDQEMLRWSQSAGRPNLQLLVLHDDAERELEYGEAADVDAARQAGWQIISMASDWNRVFARPLVKQEAIEPAEAASSPR